MIWYLRRLLCSVGVKGGKELKNSWKHIVIGLAFAAACATATAYESAKRFSGSKSSATSIWSLITIAILLGCLWVLKDLKFSTLTWRIWNIPTHNLAALFGLVYSGMDIVRILSGFHSVIGVNLYLFAECLFLGMSIAVSFYVLSMPARQAKSALSIGAALFLGINGFVAAHRSIGPSSPAFRGLFSVDGLLFGIVIPIVGSLWLMGSGHTTSSGGPGLGKEAESKSGYPRPRYRDLE